MQIGRILMTTIHTKHTTSYPGSCPYGEPGYEDDTTWCSRNSEAGKEDRVITKLLRYLFLDILQLGLVLSVEQWQQVLTLRWQNLQTKKCNQSVQCSASKEVPLCGESFRGRWRAMRAGMVSQRLITWRVPAACWAGQSGLAWTALRTRCHRNGPTPSWARSPSGQTRPQERRLRVCQSKNRYNASSRQVRRAEYGATLIGDEWCPWRKLVLLSRKVTFLSQGSTNVKILGGPLCNLHFSSTWSYFELAQSSNEP